jgi:hypothetical protein
MVGELVKCYAQSITDSLAMRDRDRQQSTNPNRTFTAPKIGGDATLPAAKAAVPI